MDIKRITVFAGYFGSGKTNIAINYARFLKVERKKPRVALADLDIVNPYFHSRGAREYLESFDARVICGGVCGLDAPALSGEFNAVFDEPELYSVIDLGGDTAGAAAIGRFREKLQSEADKQILFVLNAYRPFTRNLNGMTEVSEALESAAGFTFTGIVNNSNIGRQTRLSHILESASLINTFAQERDLPVVFTCANESLLAGNTEPARRISCVFPITIHTPALLADMALELGV